MNVAMLAFYLPENVRSLDVLNRLSCLNTDSSKCPILLRKDGFVLNEHSLLEKVIKAVGGVKVCRFKQVASNGEADSFFYSCANRLDELRKNPITGNGSPEVKNPERGSSFHTPKPWERGELRKAIQANDVTRFVELAWSNPHLIVSTSDTPVIFHEGARYNALHMCAKQNKPSVAHSLLCLLENEAFWQLLYPDDSRATRINRMNYMLDLYLNTPDKQCGELPLHIAAKFGFLSMIELLCSHPTTNREAPNFDGFSADEIAGSRCSSSLLLPFNIAQVLRHFIDDVIGPFYICCFVNKHQISQIKFKSTTVQSPRNEDTVTAHAYNISYNGCKKEKQKHLETNDEEWVLDAYFGPMTKQSSFSAITTIKKLLLSSSNGASKLSTLDRFLCYREKLELFCTERGFPLRQKSFLSEEFVQFEVSNRPIEAFEEFLRKRIRKIMEYRHVNIDNFDVLSGCNESSNASVDLFETSESGNSSLSSLASKFANMSLLSSGCNSSIDFLDDSIIDQSGDRSGSGDFASRIEDSMMLSCGDLSFEKSGASGNFFQDSCDKNKILIESTFGNAETDNLVFSLGELELNSGKSAGANNDNDEEEENERFLTPPSSPTPVFQDAYDIPFVSFCKCSSLPFGETSNNRNSTSLNNFLVHTFYQKCLSTTEESFSSSFPVMKAWSESFQSKQCFDKSKIVSYFCKNCNCVQNDEETETLVRSLKKVAHFQPFCIC